jgi:hypothetical protein
MSKIVDDNNVIALTNINYHKNKLKQIFYDLIIILDLLCPTNYFLLKTSLKVHCKFGKPLLVITELNFKNWTIIT